MILDFIIFEINSIFFSFYNSMIHFGNDTVFEGNTAYGKFYY